MRQKLELAAVIEVLREKLNTTNLAAEEYDIHFNTENEEIELQTVVKREVDVGITQISAGKCCNGFGW